VDTVQIGKSKVETANRPLAVCFDNGLNARRTHDIKSRIASIQQEEILFSPANWT
jgi:hypothetical protein